MNPWYLFRHTFNCKLPDSYHYFDERGVEWSTTDCYLKGEAIRQLLSIILFIFYILILVGETIWWTSNVRKELFIYFIPSFSGLDPEFDPDLTRIRSKFDPFRFKFDRIKCVCLQSGKNAIDLFNTFRSNQLPISFEITQLAIYILFWQWWN